MFNADQRSSLVLWLATSALVKVLDIVRVEGKEGVYSLCRRWRAGGEEERKRKGGREEEKECLSVRCGS